MIDLRPDLLDRIKSIIKKYVPEAEVWAFGSRVTWTAKDYSDLDLVIIEKEQIPKKRYYQLQEAFEESDLPIKVDVLDWHRITPGFRANIERRYEVVVDGEDKVSMSEWPIVTLKDAGVTLIDCDHKTPKAQEEGLPYVGIPQLKEGRIVLNGARLISGEDFHHWRRKAKPMPNDVILSRRCNPGETAYVPSDLEIALGQNLVLLRSDGEKLYPPFLRWVVQGSSWWNQVGKFINVGAVFDSLKCANIPDFEIILPPMAKQIRITEILGALDKKIELNRQTNQTLEQIAQAIFKSWFVDFEPVRAKIKAKHTLNPTLSQRERELVVELATMCAISGKTEEQLKDLDKDALQQLKTTAALFPDALVESELGEIPEGWGVQTVEDVIELAYGKALKKTDRIDGVYPVYGSGGLTGMHNQYLVDGPGIIVGRKGTVGSLHWEDKPFYPIDTVFYVKCKYKMTLSFSYYFLQTLGLDEMNTDAAVPGLNRNNVYRLELPKYPDDLVVNYTNLVDDFRKKIRLINKEMNTLEIIRDSLLPKLLSCEITIGDTQPVVEAVA